MKPLREVLTVLLLLPMVCVLVALVWLGSWLGFREVD